MFEQDDVTLPTDRPDPVSNNFGHFKGSVLVTLDDPKAELSETVSVDADTYTSPGVKGTIRATFRIVRLPFEFEDYSAGKF